MRKKLASLIAIAIFMGGCASTPAPDPAVVAQPDGPANSARTRFQEGLACMDRVFLDYGWRGMPLLVSGVPDHTGKVLVGSKAWLQTSFSRMSQRSGAFQVIDYDPSPDAPEQAIYALLPEQMQQLPVPAMYVRGAISGFAEGVTSRSQSLSAGIPEADGAIGRDRTASILSVDLNVGMFLNRTLVNRAYASNEIALNSRQRALSVGGRIAKFGVDYNFDASEKDGIPQATRTLIDLGAIEIAGRLTGVPYWECLGGGQVSPTEVDTAAGEIFADMAEPDRNGFAQRRLGRLGLYAGAPDGAPNPAFVQALRGWQGAQGLAPSGRVDYPTYRKLAVWGGVGATPTAGALAPPAPMPVAPAASQQRLRPATPPLTVRLALSSANPRPGEFVSLRAGANRSAFLYCYVVDANRQIARVFPNRSQPNPLLRGGEEVMVPEPAAPFRLQAQPRESVTCFASDVEVGAALPAQLRAEDLTPLPGSMDTLASEFRSAAARLKGELVIRETQLVPGR